MRLGDGAQGRNRTTDTVIFSHVLYQLSYLGAAPDGRRLMTEKQQPVQPRRRGRRYSSVSPVDASPGRSAVGMR